MNLDRLSIQTCNLSDVVVDGLESYIWPELRPVLGESFLQAHVLWLDITSWSRIDLITHWSVQPPRAKQNPNCFTLLLHKTLIIIPSSSTPCPKAASVRIEAYQRRQGEKKPISYRQPWQTRLWLLEQESLWQTGFFLGSSLWVPSLQFPFFVLF
jgi:hypothetical protein